MDTNASNNERFDKVNENLSIFQDKDCLEFTTDSYILSAFVKPNSKATALDLGAGSGVISLLLTARDKVKKIYSIEIQKGQFDILKKNVRINHFEDKICPINKDIRDLINDDFDETIDCVISNPPYFKTSHGKENAIDKNSISRRELNGDINDFCRCSSKLLKYGGLAYFVYPADRLADLVFALKTFKLEPKRMITLYPDIESKPNLVFIEAKKGAASGLIQSVPLIIYDSTEKTSNRAFSKNMEKIYDSFSTNHLFKNLKRK